MVLPTAGCMTRLPFSLLHGWFYRLRDIRCKRSLPRSRDMASHRATGETMASRQLKSMRTGRVAKIRYLIGYRAAGLKRITPDRQAGAGIRRAGAGGGGAAGAGAI